MRTRLSLHAAVFLSLLLSCPTAKAGTFDEVFNGIDRPGLAAPLENVLQVLGTAPAASATTAFLSPSKRSWPAVVMALHGGSPNGDVYREAYQLRDVLFHRSQVALDQGVNLRCCIREGGYAAGVAIIILDDEVAASTILKGHDVNAQRALFIAARSIDAALPLPDVEQLLIRVQDEKTFTAALRWLRRRHGSLARSLLSRMSPPGVVGEEEGLCEDIVRRESILCEEMKQEDGPDDMIAVFSIRHPFICGFSLSHEVPDEKGLLQALMAPRSPVLVSQCVAQVIRIRNDRATFAISSDDTLSHSLEYPMGMDDLKYLHQFAGKIDSDELPASYIDGSMVYVHLTKSGGSRVLGGFDPQLLVQYRLQPTIEAARYALTCGYLDKSRFPTVHYRVCDFMPGSKILMTHDHQVLGVWADESPKRVYVLLQKWDKKGYYAEWHELKNGALSARTVSSPFETRDGVGHYDDYAKASPWLLRGTGWQYHVRGDAMYFQPGGHEERRVAQGPFNGACASSDARWIVAARGQMLVVLDTVRNEERNLDIGDAADVRPLAWLSSQQRFLVGFLIPRRADNPYDRVETYLLIDPLTGQKTQFDGDPRPWWDNLERPLQTTGQKNEVWVAEYDRGADATIIGKFNLNTFVMTPVTTCPHIQFSSERMWVDVQSAQVYVAHAQHVLQLPLGKISR